MRKLMLVVLLVAALGTVGCKKKPKNDMAAAPGPMPLEPMPVPAPAPDYSPAPVPVAPEPLASGSPTGGGTYVVQKGDTLYAIARKTYGNASRVKDIVAANPGIDPNRIRAGQTLNLP